MNKKTEEFIKQDPLDKACDELETILFDSIRELDADMLCDLAVYSMGENHPAIQKVKDLIEY